MTRKKPPGRERSPPRGGSKSGSSKSVPRADSQNRAGGGQGSAATGPSKLTPGLYIVATPIGNAADITLRALDVLARADVVACEDTRRTAKLFAIHGIRARTTAYHDHNAGRAGAALLRRLEAGEAVALVSDAGTPLISDPGYRLVAAAVAAGIAVIPVPGASAVTAALSVAGLPTDRFFFAGFLPPRQAARRRALRAVAEIDATLVILESGRRLPAALADMAAVLGPRPAAVARELTKLHETVRRDDLAALARHWADAAGPPGELVIVTGPPAPREATFDDAAVDAMLRDALATMKATDAAAMVAAETGLARRALYARAVALKSA